MANAAYFAGHPADSEEARRALELHHAIALELAGNHDMQKVKSYRDELEQIRTAGARVELEAAGVIGDETTIGVLAGRIARGETTAAAIRRPTRKDEAMTDTGTADPVIYYRARDGKVYDEEGNEAATARTANGRDLERHAEALEQAKKQRAAMDRAGKLAPVLVRPAGSHHLELGHGGDPFSREELWPILELTAPRVGFVRAHMSADRYKHSSGWSEWRIYLRDVRKPADDFPDAPHLGKPAAGVGDATRDAINRACTPIVAEWLESDAYTRSRQHAAANALRRELEAPADYTIDRGRQTLEQLAGELAPGDRAAFGRALEQLAGARQILDAIGKND